MTETLILDTNMIHNMSKASDCRNTAVVDITYMCNTTCKYCQWGNKSTAGRVHKQPSEAILSRETLKALGAERVVLSGGEPRLHPNLEEIVQHYRDSVDDVIIITNGYSLTPIEATRLADIGVTGITVSIDSMFAEEATLTRETPFQLHNTILKNLEKIARSREDLELGINSVVSHITANRRTVDGLLNFGRCLDLDFVKFQLIFNDGYIGRTTPDLLLTRNDAVNLIDIALYIETISSPATNPAEFWRNSAALARGEEFSPIGCGLGPRYSIATREKVNICFWLDESNFGKLTSKISREEADRIRRRFEEDKLSCKVREHCFCNQSLSHTWKV